MTARNKRHDTSPLEEGEVGFYAALAQSVSISIRVQPRMVNRLVTHAENAPKVGL